MGTHAHHHPQPGEYSLHFLRKTFALPGAKSTLLRTPMRGLGWVGPQWRTLSGGLGL